MGTLDPAATGALIVCVGPATRLDAYLANHKKAYEFSIVFGQATDTDDAQGHVIRTCDVPARIQDEGFARKYIERLVGWHDQIPPAFSAIHVNGSRSYEQARKGHIISLEPRRIQIAQAKLLYVRTSSDSDWVEWGVRASVSAGTYIRAIARDVGSNLQTCAHIGDLRRIRTGNLPIEACVSLDAIKQNPREQIIDPVRLLGFRFTFASDACAKAVENGRPLSEEKLNYFIYRNPVHALGSVSCSSDVTQCVTSPADGERLSVIVGKRLKAIYAFDADHKVFRPQCVFAIGVSRGFDIDY